MRHRQYIFIYFNTIFNLVVFSVALNNKASTSLSFILERKSQQIVFFRKKPVAGPGSHRGGHLPQLGGGEGEEKRKKGKHREARTKHTVWEREYKC